MIAINIFVAFTNFIGLLFINNKLSYVQLIILLCPIIASCLYHLSETKHNLYGIYPLNKYTNELLIIDRFFAIVSFIIIIIKLFTCRVFKFINLKKLIKLIIIGTISLIISERDIIYQKLNIYNDFVVNKFVFLFFHSIWHIVAFTIYGNIININ